MSQIKEDFKTNEFKHYQHFDQNLFGRLYLNDPFKSKILTRQQSSELLVLCQFEPNNKFKLLYRASQDGFGSNDFHSKCDGHANTLTIFKASQSSYIFDGFTSATWDGGYNQWKSDPNAFVFSLTNKDNKPCIIKIDPNEIDFAIVSDPKYGPIFGGGNDICIYNRANKNTNSFSYLGKSYKHPQYAYGTIEAKSFLAGSEDFQLSEIEVYQKE